MNPIHAFLLSGIFLTVIAGAASADCLPNEDVVVSCEIQGRDRKAAICLAGNEVIYRYGAPDAEPELTLRQSLMDLGYLRNAGPGNTIDEIATFTSGDFSYRFTMGFKDGIAPDPTALNRFGNLVVERAGKIVTDLTCQPDTIIRDRDLLLVRMRKIGREQDSHGEGLSNYAVAHPAPAAQSPACAQDFNVDTCWSRGVETSRDGDLPGALAHYDMSCDAGLTTSGCYEAGKLYLQNRQLRDYSRAQDRFRRVCHGDDPGQGPYACKYLGWMALTGTGTDRDLDAAWANLSRACFLHNDALMIDPEGCHFFAQTVQKARYLSRSHDEMAGYLSYIALAMGCTDGAEGICDEGEALFAQEAARSASWISRCDRDVGGAAPAASCSELIARDLDYETSQKLRAQIFSLFLPALDRLN